MEREGRNEMLQDLLARFQSESPERSCRDLQERHYPLLLANRLVYGVDHARKMTLRSPGGGSARRIVGRLSSGDVHGNAFEAIDRLNLLLLSHFVPSAKQTPSFSLTSRPAVR
jgi:hypothetical protein